jgi:hypothetical protein
MDIAELKKFWIIDTGNKFSKLNICTFANQVLLFDVINWRYKIHGSCRNEFEKIKVSQIANK